MKLEQLLEAYGRVGEPLKKMGLGRLSKEPKRFDSSKDVLKHMRGFNFTQAWIGFQSANIIIGDGAIQESYPEDYGMILAAECWKENTAESLHVRHDGDCQGAWLATRFQQGQGDDFLVDDIGFIATDRKLGKARYRRFWRIDPQYGVEPCLACFIGFHKD